MYEVYESWDKAKFIKLEFSTVEITDDGNDLITGETWSLHSDIIKCKPTTFEVEKPSWNRRQDFDPDHNIDVAPQICWLGDPVTNPQEGTAVIMSGAYEFFHMTLISTAGIDDKEVWVPFRSSGLEIEICPVEPTKNAKCSLIVEKFKVKMKTDREWGTLQFVCKSNNVRYCDRECNIGTLLTIYFYKTFDIYQKLPYPIDLTVIPVTDQVFVPMLAGQMLELVTPNTSTIRFVEIEHESCLTEIAIFKPTQSLKCTKFLCTRSIGSTNETIFLKSFLKDDKSKSHVVIVPPLRSFCDDKFAVLSGPVDNITLFCHNIKGFVVSTNKSIIPYSLNFLDKEEKLRIRVHNDKEMIVEIADRINTVIKIKNLHSGCVVEG